MKKQFQYKDQHDCEAVVIPCIDFRFWDDIINFIKQDLKIESFDLLSVPGCAKSFLDEKYREILVEKIKTVSVGLHNIKKIVLINHADCGAYGGRKTFDSISAEKKSHQKDLKEVKNILHKEFSTLEIIIAYADLNDKKDEVEILMI